MPSPDDISGAFDPTGGGPAPAASTAVGARTNGRNGGNGSWSRSAEDGPQPPRRPPGPSTKPALIVLALTLVLFMVGVALELASGSQSRPSAAPTRIVTARGAVLHAVPARPLLKAIVSTAQPPDDLLNALAVPKDATPVPSSAIDLGVELYDRSLRFEVPASQRDVISFFRAELPALHWRRLSQGPTGTTGTQYLILEQHPASDGHEWDIGVTVWPTFFSGQTPTSQAPVPATGTTSFTLRLYSVSDQD